MTGLPPDFFTADSELVDTGPVPTSDRDVENLVGDAEVLAITGEGSGDDSGEGDGSGVSVT